MGYSVKKHELVRLFKQYPKDTVNSCRMKLLLMIGNAPTQLTDMELTDLDDGLKKEGARFRRLWADFGRSQKSFELQHNQFLENDHYSRSANR